jgi:type I restriction enzyme S subunit
VNQHVSIVRVDPALADPGYVLAFLTHPAVKEYIESFNAGGSRRAITKGHIESFRLPLPPIGEQRAISDILQSLDDRIELNQEMNKTLEAMARALFKSWFVDFDPVRAKVAGRDPALPRHIAAFFPDSFEDSELGEIPKGWQLGKVSDLGSLSKTSISPGKYPDEEFAYFSIPAYDDGKRPRIETGAAIMSNKFVVPAGAILLSKLNPSIPRIWLPAIGTTQRSISSTEFLVVLPTRKESREFLFSLFESESFRSRFLSLVSGTSNSHQRVNPGGLLEMQAVLPNGRLIAEYTSRVRPMFERAQENIKDSECLKEMRDSLLPKLISGELRVADAERIVGGQV